MINHLISIASLTQFVLCADHFPFSQDTAIVVPIMVSLSNRTYRDPPTSDVAARSSPPIESPSVSEAVAGSKGMASESEGFARGQHTDYDTTTKPTTTVTPLAPPSTPLPAPFFRGRNILKSLAVTVVLLLTLYAALKYSYDNIHQKFEREQSDMRWKWRAEELEHDSATKRWELERTANQCKAGLDRLKEESMHERVREGWDRERCEWESENKRIREQWARERQEWEVEDQSVKENSARERRELELEDKRVKEQRAREQRELELENRRVKEKLASERRQLELNDIRVRDQREREQQEREKEDRSVEGKRARERREQELNDKRVKESRVKEWYQWMAERKEWEEERSTYLPYFEDLTLGESYCVAFNTREYAARLWNVRFPGDYRWLETCMSTEVKMNGKTIKSPDRCAERFKVCISLLLIFTTGSSRVPLLDCSDRIDAYAWRRARVRSWDTGCSPILMIRGVARPGEQSRIEYVTMPLVHCQSKEHWKYSQIILKFCRAASEGSMYDSVHPVKPLISFCGTGPYLCLSSRSSKHHF